jgi:undecaprenyl diphosphate synthase
MPPVNTTHKRLKHLAIIMDGNGRWAQRRQHSRLFGHVRGARVARTIIEAAAQRGIPYLTLYTFSLENWFRPQQEVDFLMRLLRRHLQRELSTLMANNIRFRVIGDLSKVPREVARIVLETVELTAQNTGMTLTFALSYSGRGELTAAVKTLCQRAALGTLNPQEIDEATLAQELESSFLPDPDLIIRTSGESRLSNFMLWQAAYSEILILDRAWPDFSVADLDQALDNFEGRERRFGRLGDSFAQ